jgi:phospholipase C
MTQQIFGQNAQPGSPPNMSGFFADYATTSSPYPEQIMQSFAPANANVINQLAANFAICDSWFASCPCQTWPNRGFVHTGSSDGHINNDDYELYDIPTIFNVLEGQGISWGVFHDSTLIPSLTLGQFLPKLGEYLLRFHSFTSFQRCCAGLDGVRLPQYSFVEPRFMPELGLLKIDYPSDYHPPHNVCRGEQFLAQVYEAVRSSCYRDEILLVITFDEHGGCYDHLPPLPISTPPQPWPQSRDGQFNFERFGVRVPTIVVSSYVNPGTVFRAPTGSAPYDHTSILATLRDWLSLPASSFLPSPRIANAPTLAEVLALPNPRTDWPKVTPQCQIDASDEDLDTPLNDVQKSLIATVMRLAAAQPSVTALQPQVPLTLQQSTAAAAKSFQTYRDALKYLYPNLVI